ncbi:MAG: hypothetical protein AAF755_07345 [Pseudomonadota bacterium]
MGEIRRPVASLWVGDKLHYLNQLCLKSHVAQGHPVTLYCTDKVENAPEGVTILPAQEIMDIDLDLVEATSASFLSNVFRYEMIRKTGAIWIDCDAFCSEPFPDDWDYIFAGHGMRNALNCGVVGLPQSCTLIDLLLEYYAELPDYPPWWGRHQRKKMDKLSDDDPLPVRIYTTERTAFGPQAFTYFAKQTGDYDRAMTSDVLYPVPFQLNDIFYDPYGYVEGHFSERTVSVHLYTNGTKPWWRKNVPLENSYAWRMCRQLDIDPEEALEI